MKRFFKLKKRGTTVKTEFIANMTTFLATVYILMVNANMFADPFGNGANQLGVPHGMIFLTALPSVRSLTPSATTSRKSRLPLGLLPFSLWPRLS